MNHRKFLSVFLISLTILLFFPGALGTQGSWNTKTVLTPDLIIHNGNIITMEQSLPQATALAIQGDSIIAVGDENDTLPLTGSNTRLIDLKGKTLLPGFIDSHSH